MEVDYIIVGQGLAGSALALQLLKRRRKFVVFDDPRANHSSRIAAGLFNPITGRRMGKTWLAELLLPYLQRFYSEAENLSGERFHSVMPLYRPFVSIEEQNEWMAKSSDVSYSAFLDNVFVESIHPALNDPFGGILLKNSGYLDTEKYIRAVALLIRKYAALEPQILDTEKVVIGADSVRYGDIQAKKVIVCSGVHQNRWFDWLPITPLKGETITIRNNFPHDYIVNRGVYLVPGKQPGLWRVGSTYDFRDRSEQVTDAAKADLQRKLAELIDDPYEITEHQWGFRPTTPDRRPILGKHPEHPALVVFNGLGTKGVSLAPYFSEVLIHWLENSGTLHKEVDIERYKSLYWGSP